MKLIVLFNEAGHSMKGVEIYPTLFAVSECRFEDKDIPKTAGFWWDATKKRWWTYSPEKAQRLAEYADADCKRHLSGTKKQKNKTVVESRSTSDAHVTRDIKAPPGKNFFPYQRAGIQFGLERDSVLIGDVPGLGKTSQAIGIVDHSKDIKTVIVVCPASLKINWDREIAMWSNKPFMTYIAGSKPDEGWTAFKSYGELIGVKYLIINYDILHNWRSEIDSMQWDCIICDEAHYLKSGNSRRAKQTFATKAKKKIFLTGTPFLSRPIEIFPILKYLDKKLWSNKHTFALKYCNAIRNGFGWDYKGASNLIQLQKELRSTVMIRRLKEDVLKDLPPKRRQIIEIPPDTAKKILAQEKMAWSEHEETLANLMAEVEMSKASDNPEDYPRAVEKLREANKVAFDQMAVVRHEIAMEKVPFAIEQIEQIVEDGTKVVVFAIHKDVVAALAAAFEGRCAVVTGAVSSKTRYIEGKETSLRQIQVDKFQKDPNCVAFFGNIHAAGVGLTLTAAAHVMFLELDWVPGVMTQCEDRCHRISQTNAVLVQHLVLAGSLDSRIAKELVRKQEILDMSLDKQTDEVVEDIYVDKEPASSRTKWVDIEKLSKGLTPQQISQVHVMLQKLASYTDKAWKDNAGFNSVDSKVGKNLATRFKLTPKQAALGATIAHKYRRQLEPADQDVVGKIIQ